MSLKTRQIWLVRHGETAWSLSGQHTGWTDLDLLPESEAKLRALEPYLQKHAFAQVWSSPLKRAYRTAQLAGFASPQMDPDLREWNYGDYDGLTKSDIRQRVPDWNVWSHGVQNGETLAQVADRARRVITRAQAVEGDVLLFSHGHMLRILASCWLGLPPENAEHLSLSTGAISILGWDDGYPALTRWNWQPGQP